MNTYTGESQGSPEPVGNSDMLQVEDGQLQPAANSYVSYEDCEAYCIARNLWPATKSAEDDDGNLIPDINAVAQKEAAIIRAFDWLNGLDWLGDPIDWQQESAWPRYDVPVPGKDDEFIPEDMIPKAVIQAQMEMAALIYGGEDVFAPKERGGKVISESHSQGNIDVIGGDSDSYTYSEAAPIETSYPSVTRLIKAFLASVPGENMGSGMIEAGRG